MLKKSNITGRYYSVESLSLEEKIRLGFDREAVSELKKVKPEQKKSPVKKRKEDKD
jgi:hypothetical protein